MRRDASLAELLVVENDAAILEFKCPKTGLLLWPLVRMAFLRMMMSDLLYTTPLVGTANPKRFLFPAVVTLGKSVVHNLRNPIMPRNICLMASTEAMVLKDGKWFNRLSDYFAQSAPEATLQVEDQFNWNWPFPRHFDNVYLHAPLLARAWLIGRAMRRSAHDSLASSLINFVVQRAKRYVGWDPGIARTASLISGLARQTAALPMLYRSYETLFRTIGCRVLIKEMGCYGHSAVAIHAARSSGIVTGEYQHGAVSLGHDAYNVAPVLARSAEYRNTLPDYFLGYGRWWNEQMNIPITKLAIGNPQRTEQLRTLGTNIASRNDVLILGDGIETDVYVGLARRLADLLRGSRCKVVFRPHPLERAEVTRRFGNQIDAIRIDTDRNVYQSLIRALAVISEVSTGLFEAVGLAEKVFIWDTAKARFGYPSHPFQRFGNAEELAEMLGSNDTGAVESFDGNAVWEPDWRTNYENFLQRQCGLRREVMWKA